MNNNLREDLALLENSVFGQGATKSVIASAELQLKTKFSKSFKDFLENCGWMESPRLTIYGLGEDVPLHLNLIRNTLSEQKQFKPKIPGHLIPFSNIGTGDHYCLDTFHWAKEECPIVFWNHERDENQMPEIVAANFLLWLRIQLDTLG